jgi:uncharacterized membrane protein
VATANHLTPWLIPLGVGYLVFGMLWYRYYHRDRRTQASRSARLINVSILAFIGTFLIIAGMVSMA